jgi:hypothetical protein
MDRKEECMHTGKWARAAVFALVAFGAVPAVGQDLTPERQAAARRAMIAWFECVECTDGELKALLSFGRALEQPLIAILTNGFSPAKAAEVERKLRARYKLYTASGPLPMTENEYVKEYLDNGEARYRSRAAIALGQLAARGSRAEEELDRVAGATNTRHDVREAAQLALDQIRGP